MLDSLFYAYGYKKDESLIFVKFHLEFFLHMMVKCGLAIMQDLIWHDQCQKICSVVPCENS